MPVARRQSPVAFMLNDQILLFLQIIFKLIIMAINLHNRNFLKLLDFTPEEIRWYRKTVSEREKYCIDLREGLNPHQVCF
jgi:hypothetical protein